MRDQQDSADRESSFDEDATRPFSKKEIAEIRAMVTRDTRVQWLWSSLRIGAVWVAAVVAGVTIGFDALKLLLKRLIL